jgi:flavin-dependent dehydrogenase
MAGSLLGRPGLLVAGDAAGMTYSFSGEGIGKAMQSGILAADTILDCRSLPSARLAVPERYAARLREDFGDRFRTYRAAQRWLASPLLCNLLTWRARRSPYLRQGLEAILDETADARAVFSFSGLLKALGW